MLHSHSFILLGIRLLHPSQARRRVDKSSNSRSRLPGRALIEFEPARIFLESRRKFSLVWPGLMIVAERWRKLSHNSHLSTLGGDSRLARLEPGNLFVSLLLTFFSVASVPGYTHRIGRTGRAGKTGIAVTFLTQEDSGVFYDLKQLLLASPVSTYTISNRRLSGEGEGRENNARRERAGFFPRFFSCHPRFHLQVVFSKQISNMWLFVFLFVSRWVIVRLSLISILMHNTNPALYWQRRGKKRRYLYKNKTCCTQHRIIMDSHFVSQFFKKYF